MLAAVATLAGCASMTGPRPIAVASMNPTQGNTATGTVSFVQRGGQVLVDVHMSGLTPGPHGIHIHEKGDCSAPDAASAGGHFNPDGAAHGAPGHGAHHAGDFGNLTADASGKAELEIAVPTPQFTLVADAPNSIVGKALVVHADPDDLKTQPSGNSGKRVACGIIALK
ncbi:superoxide dismutase family protein [Oxalobacteraceae bacterium OM1]|nr:superoxide dismutase family protein [Oxalobacteraceae bacterium OM1]